MQNSNWLNKLEYPFRLQTFSAGTGNINYIDEGSGNVIIFIHGTPEWSFAYRNIIKELSKTFRCIAADHLGFGLSDKPKHADYSVAAHAKRLTIFIETLQFKNIILVAGDFGGAMALHYAMAHPQNVKQIVLWNTWMWDLRKDKNFAAAAKFVHTWFGEILYKIFNAPVNLIMPQAYGDKKKLTKAIHMQYKKPLPNAAARVATYAIAKQISDAGDWWNTQWQQLKIIEHLPITVIWGMQDRFIKPYMLEKWKQRLPDLQIVKVENAGHFVAEEAPEIFIDTLGNMI